MIVAAIVLPLLIFCIFVLGYFTALYEISKAMEKTLDASESFDGDFERGVYWAIAYIIDHI